MSYYVRENGIVVKKEGNDPKALRLKSYYLPNDDNVYHCSYTPEEYSYWGEQHRLEEEYMKIEYFNNASDNEKALLSKAGFLDRDRVKIYYRKWYRADDIHWCSADPYFRKEGIMYIGSSGQEFRMVDYGTYWVFDKNDFKPIETKRRYYSW